MKKKSSTWLALLGSRRPTPWGKMACARRYARGCERAPGLTDVDHLDLEVFLCCGWASELNECLKMAWVILNDTGTIRFYTSIFPEIRTYSSIVRCSYCWWEGYRYMHDISQSQELPAHLWRCPTTPFLRFCLKKSHLPGDGPLGKSWWNGSWMKRRMTSKLSWKTV